MFETLALELSMSAMAATSRDNTAVVSARFCCERHTSSVAEMDLPEFCDAMDFISSADAEVSSRAAACSDAPWARHWLEAAICDAALANCSARALSSNTVSRRAV